MLKNTKLKISIIGCGRLGLTLAFAISKEKHPEISVVSTSSRSDKSLNNAREILNKYGENILFTKDNFLAASISNCIFICTPDDKIKEVCDEIFNPAFNFNPAEISVFHFSGLKKIDVLNSAKAAGASVACMHPIKSFASVSESIKTLEDTLYGVTYDKSDAKIRNIIKSLADVLKGRTIFVENDKKTLYHISACIASNYLVSLLDIAIETGELLQLNPEIFLSGLINLSQGTLNNIKKLGTKKALTGPIARGDLSTIKEHIESLKKLKRKDLLQTYQILGEKTAKIAFENKWIDDKTYNELSVILNN